MIAVSLVSIQPRRAKLRALRGETHSKPPRVLMHHVRVIYSTPVDNTANIIVYCNGDTIRIDKSTASDGVVTRAKKLCKFAHLRVIGLDPK